MVLNVCLIKWMRVNESWEMLKKHNGFFLSDVVGLGKTMIATLIAKQFLFLGGRDYNPNILLIVPPALKQNWEDTLMKFEIRGKVKIFTNGSLHKITSPKDYDMVIVDETHKFRNDTAQAYDQLQQICKTKTSANKAKKVMLISATPLNNRPDDLYNQILLFQDGNNSTLDFPLASFFTKAKKEYKEILQLSNNKKAREQTTKLYEEIRERVITPLMVRKTRTDLINSERYKKDLDEHGVVFPKTTPPKPIYYQLEKDLEYLYDDTIKKIDKIKQDKTGLLHTIITPFIMEQQIMFNLSLQNGRKSQKIDNIIYHSLAENTWLAYQKGWRCFEAYCRQTKQTSLPAGVETVVGFLVYLSSNPSLSSNKPLSIGTIILYRSAVQKVHQLSNYQSPTNDPKVSQIIAGLKRMLGTAPKRVSALRNFHIEQMLKKCSNTPIGVRNAAILVLGFAAALRRSEICQLKYGDIEIIKATKQTKIRMTIIIRKSKTDQESKGQKIAIVEGV